MYDGVVALSSPSQLVVCRRDIHRVSDFRPLTLKRYRSGPWRGFGILWPYDLREGDCPRQCGGLHFEHEVATGRSKKFFSGRRVGWNLVDDPLLFRAAHDVDDHVVVA